ncbi:transposase [Nonomuraea rhizosphaerae]|uniref:transposase n=1 Tax=Nonomuraea rhizosphaerae TaxID=2665663 RepID=UPI00355846B0
MECGDLPDDEWALAEPYMRWVSRGPIPDPRWQFNAVMWRFRVGGPCRDLPVEYGSWSTVYDRFRS